MIHLAKELKKAISKMLNNNSQEVEFDVNLFTYNRPEYFINKKYKENSYDIEESRYIISLIEGIETDFEDVPEMNISNPYISMSFSVPVSDTFVGDFGELLTKSNFNAFYSALDEIRLNNQGKMINLGEIGYFFKKDYTVTFGDDTQTYSHFGLDIKFLENTIENDFVTGNNDFSISKTEEVLSLKVGNTTKTIPYEKEKYYNIEFLKQGNEVRVYLSDIDGELIEEIDFGDVYLPEEITLKEFNGYYFYAGMGEEFKNDKLIIENFDTLENEVEDGITDIEKSYENGAISFGNSGDITVTFTTPQPSSNRYNFGVEGVSHQIYDYGLSLTYTKDLFMGNHFKYKLNDVEIYPLSRNQGFTSETDPDQKINGNTTKSFNVDNILANTFSTYHKNVGVLNEIFRKYNTQDVEQSEVWNFKVEYPTHNEEYEVIVKSLGNNTVYNAPAVFTIEMELADNL